MYCMYSTTGTCINILKNNQTRAKGKNKKTQTKQSQHDLQL